MVNFDLNFHFTMKLRLGILVNIFKNLKFWRKNVHVFKSFILNASLFNFSIKFKKIYKYKFLPTWDFERFKVKFHKELIREK